jgi:hypothetical protein
MVAQGEEEQQSNEQEQQGNGTCHGVATGQETARESDRGCPPV